MVFDLPVMVYIVVAISAFFIGLSKAGFGGMMGSLVTLFLAWVMPIEDAVGIMLPILMFGDLFALYAYWKKWDWGLIKLMTPGAVIGVTLGTVFITSVSIIVFRRTLGVIVLIFVAYRLLETMTRKWFQFKSRGWHGVAAGGISGFTSTIAHAADSPTSIYLLLQNLEPIRFLGTMVLFFAVMNWIKLPYYLYADLINFELLGKLIAAILVFEGIGIYAGRKLTGKVDKITFERIILALLGLSAILLLVR